MRYQDPPYPLAFLLARILVGNVSSLSLEQDGQRLPVVGVPQSRQGTLDISFFSVGCDDLFIIVIVVVFGELCVVAFGS